MKKILMVNEFSYLSTGYSTYGRELLSRLHKNPNYKVAEFATYVHSGDPRLRGVPWDVYCNLPDPGNEQQQRMYGYSPTNAFGEWRFEEVCLNYKPDIVFAIRDWWMDEFILRSPFRNFFKFVWMPTVDAYPQNEQWIHSFSKADVVHTYTDWSGKVLKDQAGENINWLRSTPPAANPCYQPLDLTTRKQVKQSLGFHPDTKIIGTVMRNQRRKLYPELFAAFREYLDQTGDENTILYCHTSYPDKGWDFPQLIKQHGLSSKVYFTYVCASCGYAFPSTFQDAKIFCPQCGQQSAGLANVQRGVPPESLARIIGLFDLYVQYANCEGFGMPQIEAAACGVPVVSTDYSAMSDAVRKVNGYPIPVKHLYKELETGCMRAYPDADRFVDILKDYFCKPESLREIKRIETRNKFEEYYSWDKTAQGWMNTFDNIEVEPIEKRWLSEPMFFRPAEWNEEFVNKMSNDQYAAWLINNVLCEPDKRYDYLYTKLLRDLNYGAYLEGFGGNYYNEQSQVFTQPSYEPFDRKKAYDQMINLCNKKNFWEQRRKASL